MRFFVTIRLPRSRHGETGSVNPVGGEEFAKVEAQPDFETAYIQPRRQALAPLWISPDSKAARGWHLRTGQTEGGQLAQMPKLGRLVQAAAGFHEILGGTLGHL